MNCVKNSSRTEQTKRNRKRSLFQKWKITLAPWLPYRLRNDKATLLYSSDVHGMSLRTLYRLCEDSEPLLLIIQSMNNEVFGAFLSSSLKERFGPKGRNRRFFGTGETFLFRLHPNPERYDWIGLSSENKKLPYDGSLFISADNENFVVGGGGGEAIQLDDSLFRGRSQRCRTFANEPLAGGGGGGGGSDNGDFIVKCVEVVGFDGKSQWKYE